MNPSGLRGVSILSLALLVVAAPPSPVSAADAAADLERELMAKIQEVLSAEGPYSTDLLEPLQRLIALYREEEDDALAIVAIERARQVVRVNEGLYTLEQIPLLQQLIAVEESRGNEVAAWQLEQDLLALVRRYPDDLRTVPVLRDAADRQMRVVARYLRGEKPPQLYLGCYYKESQSERPGDCESGSRKTVVQGMVGDAQRSYAEAIAVILRNELYSSQELRDLEVALLRGIDLVVRTSAEDEPSIGRVGRPNTEPWRSRMAPIVELTHWDLPYLGRESTDAPYAAPTKPHQITSPYLRGRQSMQRLFAYEVASSRPLLSQAQAVAQLADWELLHANHGHAVDIYALVGATLRKADVDPAAIDRLFLPEVPVVLPVFQPNPLAPDESRRATGHIDVTFDITKYGRGRAVEIVGTANAARVAQARLVQLITGSRFRPRPADGEFGVTSRVALRYYLYADAGGP